MESALAIANYFVGRSLEEKVELTPMKLVKLVYIAHGWYLGLNSGKKLINEEVQAWKYGPVIESVYQKFRKYGASQITEKATDLFGFNDYSINDQTIIPFLDKIWSVYKGYTGTQLSALTHQNGTPWQIAYNQMGGRNRERFIIPDKLITGHYVELAQKNAR